MTNRSISHQPGRTYKHRTRELGAGAGGVEKKSTGLPFVMAEGRKTPALYIHQGEEEGRRVVQDTVHSHGGRGGRNELSLPLRERERINLAGI